MQGEDVLDHTNAGGIILAWSMKKHCSSRFDYSPRGFIHIHLPLHRLLVLGVSSIILSTPFGKDFSTRMIYIYIYIVSFVKKGGMCSYLSIYTMSLNEGPLHTWAKNRDLVMVIEDPLTLIQRPLSWVLGKLFYVVAGPKAQCEVRVDHVAGPLHILLVEKEGRVWFNIPQTLSF